MASRPVTQRWFAFRSVRGDVLGIADGCVIFGALLLALLGTNHRSLVTPVLAVVLYGFVWRSALLATNLYQREQATRGLGVAVAICFAFGMLAPTALIKLNVTISYRDALLISAFTAVSIVLLRMLVNATALPGRRRVLIVGSGPRALSLFRQLMEGSAEHNVLGIVDTGAPLSALFSDKSLGTLDDFSDILMRTQVDEVLVALPMRSHYDTIEKVIRACELGGVQVRYPANVFSCDLARASVDSKHGMPAVTLSMACEDWRVAVKRVIDIVGALIGLVLCAPIFVLVALAVKATSHGPIFFAQERFGYRKNTFRMFKFRTMVPNAEALMGEIENQNEKAGPIFKIKNDPRITTVGCFLRRSSLDELPQLWNVLTGEMSLVGPRPLSTRDVMRFDEPWLMRRFSVRPGITGLWQVSGRSNLEFVEWMRLDLSYIDGWSLSRDAEILFRTVPAVFRTSGAM